MAMTDEELAARIEQLERKHPPPVLPPPTAEEVALQGEADAYSRKPARDRTEADLARHQLVRRLQHRLYMERVNSYLGVPGGT
jgi:hypothetical protein